MSSSGFCTTSSDIYQYPSPSSDGSSSTSYISDSHRLPDSSTLQPIGRSKPFSQASTARLHLAHPYARLAAKKDDTKRRRIWNHVLEKQIFTPYELSTLGAPHRRTIYLASLEAHIDNLLLQLSPLGCSPVSAAELEPFRGLNCKTAKSMVSNLQHEFSVAQLKLLELQRANSNLEKLLCLGNFSADGTMAAEKKEA